MRASFIVPGSLETPTGGYRYDREVVIGLRARGHRIDLLTLGDGFPAPDPATLRMSYRMIGALPERAVVIDGLALGALPQIGRHLPPAAPLLALVHHPLALESGLTAKTATALRDSEREALTAARHVIVTSQATADLLIADYGVAQARVSVARPGVAEYPLAGGGDGKTVRLLAVGSVIARKGHDLLIDALAPLAALPWRLTIVGDDRRDTAAVAALSAAIARHSLQDRVILTGALSDEALAGCYHAADLFVLSSRYEGYGMVFSEALAHGLPIVAAAVGEAAALLPPGAGALVPPGDATAMSAALRPLLADHQNLAAAKTAARTARAALPRWSDCVSHFEEVLLRHQPARAA
jgi:glycosyltransferase involved in cell wall biosynthesis